MELGIVVANLCLIFLVGVLQLTVSLHTELGAFCREEEGKMKGGRIGGGRREEEEKRQERRKGREREEERA